MGFDPVQSVVVSRSALATYYTNADGTRTAVMASHPINYESGDGSFDPIDDHLVVDADRPGGLANAANAWRVHFGSTGQGVSLDTASGSVGLAPVGAADVPVVKSGDGTSVVYADAWAGADLTYAVTDVGVEQSVLIKSRVAGSSFTFAAWSGSASNVLLRRNVNTSPPSVRARDGSVSLAGAVVIERPMVLDAQGAPVEGAHAALSVLAGQLVVSVRSCVVGGAAGFGVPDRRGSRYCPGAGHGPRVQD